MSLKIYNNPVRSFFLSFFILLFSGCSKTVQIRPNIILIIGDDHGYPYFGFMGSDDVITPNMDTLANSGVLFTNGYVPENHCRPALQSLVTGTLPVDYKKNKDLIRIIQRQETSYQSMDSSSKKIWEQDFDYHALKYFETMPGKLQERGYKSFQAGKWWEYHYEYGGFTDGMTKGWTRKKRDGRNWFEQFMGGEGTDIGRKTNQPVFNFIQKNKHSPFFIWYAPQLPHYPFDAPQKYREIYLNKGYTKSAIEYYANCTWFDDALGGLLRFLQSNDLYDNTLFIYVNDNGWEQEPHQEFINDPMRSHNGGDKGKLSVFDSSFRTPIIFSWKNKIKSGIRKSDLIHSTDIPATILDYAGLQVPENYHGISYRSIIENKSHGKRSRIIGKSKKIRDEIDPMGRDVDAFWVRENEWFYKLNVTDNTEALFDVNTDPFCYNDLKKENLEVSSRLKNEILEWGKEKN